MDEKKVTDEQKANAEEMAAKLAELSEHESRLAAMAGEAFLSGFLAGMQTAKSA